MSSEFGNEKCEGEFELTCDYSGESPLYQALQVLHNEGLSSVAVVDSQMNVLGNISIVDVKVSVLCA